MSEQIKKKIEIYVWGKQLPTECSEFAEFILQMMKDCDGTTNFKPKKEKKDGI